MYRFLNVFQKCWPNINVNNFHVGLEDTFVFQSLQNLKEELLIFCINQLKQYQPRAARVNHYISWSNTSKWYIFQSSWANTSRSMDVKSYLFYKNIFIS